MLKTLLKEFVEFMFRRSKPEEYFVVMKYFNGKLDPMVYAVEETMSDAEDAKKDALADRDPNLFQVRIHRVYSRDRLRVMLEENDG